MVRKIFALASVSALAGIISGVGVSACSDDESPPGATNAEDSGVPDAKSDARPKPIDDGGEDPIESCMVTEPIDPNKYPYAPASKPSGVCSTDDAKALAAYYKSTGNQASVTTWKTKVDADCAKCVFSDGNGATWTPIITRADALGTINRGGCIEAAGLPLACGKAYQAVAECIYEACATNCKSQEEFDACRSKDDGKAVADGPCKTAYQKRASSCDQAKLAEAEQKCNIGEWTFDGPIKVMCVDGPKPDGGTPDAGDDAGDGG